MTTISYLGLPINADEGFPQAFRLALGDQVYQMLIYVDVLEEVAAAMPDDGVFDLPAVGAFMVLRVLRETAGAPQVIFQRKLVRNLPYEAAELGLLFTTMQVAKRNLNGTGAFGSVVTGGVMTL